jgi:hypothetical protein
MFQRRMDSHDVSDGVVVGHGRSAVPPQAHTHGVPQVVVHVTEPSFPAAVCHAVLFIAWIGL